MERLAGALDLGEDVGGLGGPDEGLGVLVVLFDVALDRCDQLWDITKDAAPQTVLGEVAEESLDHVQPRRARRREMEVESGMALEPTLHLLVLVRGVVVHDQMQLLFRRHHVVERLVLGSRNSA